MRNIGNDIVDLKQAQQETPHPRFFERVFTQQEQAVITQSPNPEWMGWLFWSAKEATYKSVAKLDANTVFSHQRFAIELTNKTAVYAQLSARNQSQINIDLSACYQQQKRHLCADLDDDKIHTVAYSAAYPISDDTLMTGCQRVNTTLMAHLTDYFTPQEQASIHHPAAATVRYAVKRELAQQLGMTMACIHLIRENHQNKMRPPYVCVDGERSLIDLSFSHHGDWVAWAINLTEN